MNEGEGLGCEKAGDDNGLAGEAEETEDAEGDLASESTSWVDGGTR